MGRPLYVAFVWHMHQPYYLDDSGASILPWVRLHAAKDYFHMVDVLEDYPSVHATFNMVPSLVEQLQAYAGGGVFDRAWSVSLKEHLSPDDKQFIDSLFYAIDSEKFIRSFPRYWQLLTLRNAARGDLDLLSETYWRDLVALFNLAWIDPTSTQRDPMLRALVAKGSHFTLEDVAAILAKQRGLMEVTLTAYRRLQCRAQVELSVSPYYHPILPLLIDSSCAVEPSPWTRLPEKRFSWRGDALEQLRMAVDSHEMAFGRAPAGLWPSEGSVNQATVELLGEVPEIRWFATDEAILARSLGKTLERNAWGYLADPRFLYQPYWVGSAASHKIAVFRDHYLSDRIGFAYQNMTGRQGAEDLMFRLFCIQEMLKESPEPHLVTIVLDGENCWEHYEHNGETFLRSLYEMISRESWIRTVTVSEYVGEFAPLREIPVLATGSWINGNLETWIGEDSQNRAWEYLCEAREAFDTAATNGVAPERLKKAKRSMMAAEGSDWYWWYYSRNVSDQDALFDRLFRHHLSSVYRALGLAVPDWVSVPIISDVPKLASRAPTGHVHPPLDGVDLTQAAWASAGYVEPKASTGSMQQSSGLLKRLYFGYDESALYLRIESYADLSGCLVEAYVARLDGTVVEIVEQPLRRAARVESGNASSSREIAIRPGNRTLELNRWQEGSGWVRIDGKPRLLVRDALIEAGVPLDDLGVSNGSSLALWVVLFKDGVVIQRLPEEGEIVLDLPRISEQGTVEANNEP